LEELKAIVILGNKTDLQAALTREQLAKALEIDAEALGEQTDGRNVEIFPCSLVDGTGYAEAFKWLARVL